VLRDSPTTGRLGRILLNWIGQKLRIWVAVDAFLRGGAAGTEEVEVSDEE